MISDPDRTTTRPTQNIPNRMNTLYNLYFTSLKEYLQYRTK